MSLRVDDFEPSLGGGEDQGFPLDFCLGGGGFPTPDGVSYNPSDLTTHGWVRVLNCCHVPHGGEEHLIGYKDSPCQGEPTGAPVN